MARMKSMVGSGHGWQGIARSLKKKALFFYKKENYTNEHTCLLIRLCSYENKFTGIGKEGRWRTEEMYLVCLCFKKNFSLHQILVGFVCLKPFRTLWIVWNENENTRKLREMVWRENEFHKNVSALQAWTYLTKGIWRISI